MYAWTIRRPEKCILKFLEHHTYSVEISRYYSNVTLQSPHRALGQIYDNIYSFKFDMKKSKTVDL